MINPASYLPSSMAGMILSNGTTSVCISGANSLSASTAVVNVPGMAIFSFFTSSGVHCLEVTIIGP